MILINDTSNKPKKKKVMSKTIEYMHTFKYLWDITIHEAVVFQVTRLKQDFRWSHQ